MDIFVIGVGFVVVEEVMFLIKYGKLVIIIVREFDFICVKLIGDKVKVYLKIIVKFNIELIELIGDVKFIVVKFKNNVIGEIIEYKVKVGEIFGVFVFVGYVFLS